MKYKSVFSEHFYWANTNVLRQHSSHQFLKGIIIIIIITSFFIIQNKLIIIIFKWIIYFKLI